MAAEEVHHEVFMCSNPRRMIGTIKVLTEATLHNIPLRIIDFMRNANPRLTFSVTLSSSPNRFPLYARRRKQSWLAEPTNKVKV